jgi:hypothetical protein
VHIDPLSQDWQARIEVVNIAPLPSCVKVAVSMPKRVSIVLIFSILRSMRSRTDIDPPPNLAENRAERRRYP